MFTSNEAPGNYKVKNNGPDDIIISVKDENGELVDPEYPKAVGANTTTAPFGIGQDETLFIEDPDSSPDEDGASGWAQGPFN